MLQLALIKQIVPADAAVLCHPRFNRHTVHFPKILIREFFPGNEKFFLGGDPWNSSPVKIPTLNYYTDKLSWPRQLDLVDVNQSRFEVALAAVRLSMLVHICQSRHFCVAIFTCKQTEGRLIYRLANWPTIGRLLLIPSVPPVTSPGRSSRPARCWLGALPVRPVPLTLPFHPANDMAYDVSHAVSVTTDRV